MTSQGSPWYTPRVAIGHGPATARVIVVPMERALALAMAAHRSSTAVPMAQLSRYAMKAALRRVMVSPTACYGNQWQPTPRTLPGPDPIRI